MSKKLDPRRNGFKNVFLRRGFWMHLSYFSLDELEMLIHTRIYYLVFGSHVAVVVPRVL